MDILSTISSDKDIKLLPDILPFSEGIGILKAETFLLHKNCFHPISNIKNNLEAIQKLYFDELLSICKLVYPKTVRFRFSDIKSSEALHLIDGAKYEKLETNPSLGFRGLYRLTSESYIDLLKLEFEAICKVRNLGFSNLQLCFPFVRSNDEFKKSLSLIKFFNNKFDCEIWIMIEIPANLFEHELLVNKSITGFIIGTSDLYQLTFAKDRDSAIFNDAKETELKLLTELILRFAEQSSSFGKKVSVAGFLLEHNQTLLSAFNVKNIDSICLNPYAIKKYGI